jgi:biotin transporter BioY
MGGFLKRFIPFAAIIAMVLFILSFAKGFETVMTFAWVCYGLFLALTLMTFYFSAQTMEKKFSSFMNVFFVSILILSAIIVLIFKAKHNTTDVNFIIPFAIIYFSFLFFETIELVKLSRKVEEKSTPKPPSPK